MIRSGEWEKAASTIGKILSIQPAHAGQRRATAHPQFITFRQTNDRPRSCNPHTLAYDIGPLFAGELGCKETRIHNIKGIIGKCQRLSNIHLFKAGICELLDLGLGLSIVDHGSTIINTDYLGFGIGKSDFDSPPARSAPYIE